jgi:hypothetical protein
MLSAALQVKYAVGNELRISPHKRNTGTAALYCWRVVVVWSTCVTVQRVVVAANCVPEHYMRWEVLCRAFKIAISGGRTRIPLSCEVGYKVLCTQCCSQHYAEL